ncbi:RNA polymerase sigma factor [Actinomadura macrotermitis]|uniref:Uncharacterized protein n=1 Tax=Actinomadura macrotermitis TaxID=2585200 RepID=A0A7K0BWQ1_9ACTN|nr:sigma-70 family RNA polymerase sigma factor [Actinomadura macrotermitis]MQY05114.1 hypothetical protein [Actinomadura macrotermitis]
MTRWSPYDPAVDRTLVQELREEGVRALGALYDSYAERLYDYALTMTADPRVAADIVHDVFVDAGRRAPRMRDHLHLRAWLYGAARRRCLQRGRAHEPYWDVPEEERAALEPLQAALAELDPDDQELLLLTDRHGLSPADLGALLGVPPRRAAARADRARGRMSGPSDDTVPAPVVVLAARSPFAVRPRCRPRPAPAGPATALADVPAAVLPAALRHRVVHTATDPELAGYRADIVARGGGLTPAGLPNQPGVPSPITRRWLFAGGGMAGALVTALVVAQLMGLEPAPTLLLWPPGHNERQPGPAGPAQPGARPGTRPGADQPPGGRSGGAPVSPQLDGRRPQTTPPARVPHTPATSPSPSPSMRPARTGRLEVLTAKVTMYGTKTARVRLRAAGGPVRWKAVASDERLTLTPATGALTEDGSGELTVRLSSALIGLPGRATLTIADADGALKQVPVEWGVSLL